MKSFASRKTEIIKVMEIKSKTETPDQMDPTVNHDH